MRPAHIKLRVLGRKVAQSPNTVWIRNLRRVRQRPTQESTLPHSMGATECPAQANRFDI